MDYLKPIMIPPRTIVKANHMISLSLVLRARCVNLIRLHCLATYKEAKMAGDKGGGGGKKRKGNGKGVQGTATFCLMFPLVPLLIIAHGRVHTTLYS